VSGFSGSNPVAKDNRTLAGVLVHRLSGLEHAVLLIELFVVREMGASQPAETGFAGKPTTHQA